MTSERVLAWGSSQPLHVDTARVRWDDEHFDAEGTSTSYDGVVTYELRCGPDCVTRSLTVEVRDRSLIRRLELVRSDVGDWTTRGPDGVDPVDRPDLDGALDCDLALCPLTNTMPIRRLGLVAAARSQPGPTPPVRLRMAWVSLPDLQVHRSDQTYFARHRVEPSGGAVVGFQADELETSIEVDAQGFVVSYPAIGRVLVNGEVW